MRTPASIAGHPIHPMLVPIAIGGFVLSLAADLMCIATGAQAPWPTLAFYAMVGGILGALAAAIPGLVDLVSLPSGPIKRTALTHMGINLVVVATYIVNACLRYYDPQSLTIPIILSFVSVGLLLVSGWLGGKLVFEAGVGVASPSDHR